MNVWAVPDLLICWVECFGLLYFLFAIFWLKFHLSLTVHSYWASNHYGSNEIRRRWNTGVRKGGPIDRLLGGIYEGLLRFELIPLTVMFTATGSSLQQYQKERHHASNNTIATNDYFLFFLTCLMLFTWFIFLFINFLLI